MNKKFIYQDIINEFDNYIDSNLPETIYIDTLRLFKDRKVDIDFLYKEIIEEKKTQFNNYLNRVQNTKFCNNVSREKKVKLFDKISHDMIEKCENNNELYCNLNTMQVIGSNTKLKNQHFISEIYTQVENYPNTVKLTIKNATIIFSPDPYERTIELVEFINDDIRHEKFYSSFIEYYYQDFKKVIDLMIDSIRLSQTHLIAFFLPIVNQAAKNKLFPNGTKDQLIDLLEGVKQIKNTLPRELNDKYNVIGEILALNPNDYKR